MKAALTIEGLGDLAGSRYGLNAYCEGGHHRADLDVAGLIARLGERRKISTLRQVLRCTKCGTRGPVVQLHRSERSIGPIGPLS
jgi:hypothetical protein